MRFPELVEVLDTIAGDHGVGRADRTRRGAVRLEREIGESPAAVTLSAALDELERGGPGSAAAGRSRPRWSRNTRRWRTTAVGGRRRARALDAFNDSAMAAITGTVRLMLFRGGCRVVGCEIGPVTAVETTANEIGAAQPAM